MDREAQKNQKRSGVAALKIRPVIVKDLTIFGTPRSQSKRRSRSRKQRSRAFDENLNLTNLEHDLVS